MGASNRRLGVDDYPRVTIHEVKAVLKGAGIQQQNSNRAGYAVYRADWSTGAMNVEFEGPTMTDAEREAMYRTAGKALASLQIIFRGGRVPHSMEVMGRLVSEDGIEDVSDVHLTGSRCEGCGVAFVYPQASAVGVPGFMCGYCKTWRADLEAVRRYNHVQAGGQLCPDCGAIVPMRTVNTPDEDMELVAGYTEQFIAAELEASPVGNEVG